MAEERSLAHSLVAPLLGSGQAGRLRPWLLPHLKALAEARELDQPAGAASILEERRLRGLAPSVVEAVRELLALQEPDLLRDVIALLEDPTWS